MTLCDFLNPAVPLGERVRHDLGVTFAGACKYSLDIHCHLLRFDMTGPPKPTIQTPNLSRYDWMSRDRIDSRWWFHFF